MISALSNMDEVPFVGEKKSPRGTIPVGLGLSGRSGRAGDFLEGEHPADAIRRDVAETAPKPLAGGPAKPTAWNVNFQDDYGFDPSTMTLDDVENRPAGSAWAGEPDGGQPSFAFAR
jgi:hypothetical protein